MANKNLNKLCMDESDPMLNVVVRCKHGILLNLQTSWSKLNPGRRFWSCPCYDPLGPTSISSSVAPSAVAVLKRGVVVKGGEVEKVATGSSLFK
ncbi:hypothetical protein H5410_041833 [Solanum commersonii]|uniref:Zinc finger GRF-type domain-containing protein n=1 Tax=Solanum commersonii TaxID=4109 RepID=A0A9J5XUQ3_SOLCO|nr:hypothetical protein H5410_041833 [Solanum commersonii]